MPGARQRTVGALGLTLALALGLGAYRSARVALPEAVRRGVARALGVDPAAVQIGDVRLGIGGLLIDALRAGPLAARRARFVPDLRSFLGGPLTGRLEAEAVTIEDARLAELPGVSARLAIDRAEVAIGARRMRVHARDLSVGIEHGAAPLRIADLAIDLERGVRRPRRMAFTGLSLGPIVGLAGNVHFESDEIDLRAAATNARVRAHLSTLGGELTIDLDRQVLAWHGARGGAAEGLVVLSGRIHAQAPPHADAEPVTFDAELTADAGALRVPRLAPDPIDVTGLRLGAEGRWRAGGDDAGVDAQLTLSRGEVAITLAGRLASDAEAGRTCSLVATLPRTGCQDLLGALPAGLRRALDGMALDGELLGAARLRVPLDDLTQLSLDGDLTLGCHVRSEPPLADAGPLRSGPALLPGALDADGRPRRVELGPTNPAYRTLDRIPAAVIATFVEAEDGRFWQHHGLDLQQIRRALAHDFEIGAPGRGGSTITQQVAKNLFLSGERTLGRKLEESVLSWRLESRLGKRRIMELYLNLVELGPGVYGIGEGARHWFHKDVAALTPDEAVQLAALLPAPRRGMDEAFTRRLTLLRARVP